MRSVQVLVGVILGAGVAGASPLDQPAFSATAAELLAAARTAPAGDWPVVVLREDVDVAFDDQHRATRRVRMVYVIRTAEGVTKRRAFSAAWSPFFQDRPVVRARVIDPAGKVTELDPKLVIDAPVATPAPGVISDRRALTAPLPALQVGAIVEREIVWTDRRPISGAGSAAVVMFGSHVPIQSTRASISVPAARAARLRAWNLPRGVKPRVERAAGRRTWRYTLGPLLPNPVREPLAPAGDYVVPHVAVSTVASWNALARHTRAVVERQLAAGPVTLPAELPRSATLAAAGAITAWLHRRVPYTGIDLDASTNVPAPPAATLAHGSAGALDKATLLVALLRRAGIRAELALISAGPGADVRREVPSLGGFDHVLVRARVAGRAVWIDPTDELARPGQLPSSAQGRRALIVANRTTRLVATPRARPADNVVREVRTFELAEVGDATRVTEVSTFRGVFEGPARAWLRDIDPDELAKDLREYLEAEYLASGLERHLASGVEDLDRTVELTVVARGSGRAFTSRTTIEIKLFPSDVLDRLPSLVDATPARPRRTDCIWDVPHVYEIENRLVLPPGYTMPAAVPARTRRLGAATLTERRRVDGRTYVVTFRFETGTRAKPAQLARMIEEVARIRDEHVALSIEHTGMALANRGKWREALAEIDGLIRRHPKEALHHGQRAHVLVYAGMGAAARRAARRGVQLEPRDADAHVVLGWVLQHDTLGREFGFDHDRKGALAAYRTARRLGPNHAGGATELAQLLERDEHGDQFGPTADLAGAIAAWRVARALDPDDESQANSLLLALLVKGDLAALEATARAMPASPQRDRYLVAAVAGGKAGPAAARTLAGTLATGTARDTLLDNAARLLMIARLYDAARALAPPGGALRSSPQHASLLDKVRRHGGKLGAGDPRGVIIKWLHAVMRRRRDPAVFWDADVERELRAAQQHIPSIPASMHGFIEDIVRSVSAASVETLAPGLWRVDVQVPDKKSNTITYVALDRGKAKLLAIAPLVRGAGAHALRLLARNDTAAAGRLIEAVRKDLGTVFPEILAIWDAAPRERATIELVAALLAQAPQSLSALERCDSLVANARRVCDGAIAQTLTWAGRWRELARFTEVWRARDPTNAALPGLRITALAATGRLDEADKELAAYLARHPNDRQMLMLRADVTAARGDLVGSIAQYDALLKLPSPGISILNNAAWAHLIADRDLAKARTLALRAVGADPAKAPAGALHTLAAILAELGDLRAAKRALDRTMERAGVDRPRPMDLYVLGRIAEQLGLRDDAIAAYRAVGRQPSVMPDSGTLARRRLRVLAP